MAQVETRAQVCSPTLGRLPHEGSEARTVRVRLLQRQAFSKASGFKMPLDS